MRILLNVPDEALGAPACGIVIHSDINGNILRATIDKDAPPYFFNLEFSAFEDTTEHDDMIRGELIDYLEKVMCLNKPLALELSKAHFKGGKHDG